VTLEEVGNGNFGAKGRLESHLQFLQMVEIAAKQWGQDWIVTELPTVASKLCVEDIWRGMKVRWARHREWKNRKFALTRKALPPSGT
jgi:hypothetical protein